jgi:hypothetical protein
VGVVFVEEDVDERDESLDKEDLNEVKSQPDTNADIATQPKTEFKILF